MAEEEYTPDYVKITLADAQGAKSMADRRFKRFLQEVIEGGRMTTRLSRTSKKTLRRTLTGIKISSPIWVESMQQSQQSLL